MSPSDSKETFILFTHTHTHTHTGFCLTTSCPWQIIPAKDSLRPMALGSRQTQSPQWGKFSAADPWLSSSSAGGRGLQGGLGIQFCRQLGPHCGLRKAMHLYSSVLTKWPEALELDLCRVLFFFFFKHQVVLTCSWYWELLVQQVHECLSTNLPNGENFNSLKIQGCPPSLYVSGMGERGGEADYYGQFYKTTL